MKKAKQRSISAPVTLSFGSDDPHFRGKPCSDENKDNEEIEIEIEDETCIRPVLSSRSAPPELECREIQSGASAQVYWMSYSKARELYGPRLMEQRNSLHLRKYRKSGFAVKVIRRDPAREEIERQWPAELAVLEKHLSSENPHIVQFAFAKGDHEKIVIGLEYCGGGDLFDLIQSKCLDFERALHLHAELASALDCLHLHDVLHADIKPENVGIDDRGHVKLLDFGLSICLQPDLHFNNHTGRLEVVTETGTLAYASPEILKRKPHGIEADWWSFGVVFFETIFGTVPWFEPDPQNMCDRICEGILSVPTRIILESENQTCPLMLSDFFAKILEKDRYERLGYYGSGEVLECLSTCLACISNH